MGCPGWSWEEIYATAKDFGGLDGIEIRGLENEMFAPEAKPFRPENFEKTMATLKTGKNGIAHAHLRRNLADRENRGRFLTEGKSYIDLAQRAQAPPIFAYSGIWRRHRPGLWI